MKPIYIYHQSRANMKNGQSQFQVPPGIAKYLLFFFLFFLLNNIHAQQHKWSSGDWTPGQYDKCKGTVKIRMLLGNKAGGDDDYHKNTSLYYKDENDNKIRLLKMTPTKNSQPQIKIEDTDGNDFAYLAIIFTRFHIINNDFRSTE